MKNVKISVLSNAALLNRPDVVEALRKIDYPILKLDAGTDETFKKINNPVAKRDLNWVVNHLKYFKNNLIIQSLFLRGEYEGEMIDNTRPEEVEAWVNLILELKPDTVMIYPIDRNTPVETLEKIPTEQLEAIADKIREKDENIMVQVY